MNAYQRMCFLIEHMNTPFKKEIQRDFEPALNEARADELDSTGIIGNELMHYNDDGSTAVDVSWRIKKLREKSQ